MVGETTMVNGRSTAGVLCGDSSAAIAISNRRALNKLKHIRLGELWIQDKVHNRELEVRNVLGEENVADLFTKHLTERKIELFCSMLRCVCRAGRSDLGLRVQTRRQDG